MLLPTHTHVTNSPLIYLPPPFSTTINSGRPRSNSASLALAEHRAGQPYRTTTAAMEEGKVSV